MDEIQKTMLGIKLKQLRRQKGLSFQQLSMVTGISISYLNEIEKGKKRPRLEKVHQLEEALQVKPGYLSEGRVNSFLQPLTNLLNSGFLQDLPLEAFGISQSKVVQAIAEAPLQISAFIQTLLDFTGKQQRYGENFYMAALRTFKSLNTFRMEEAEENAALWYDAEFSGLENTVDRLEWLETNLLDVFNWRVAEIPDNLGGASMELPCFYNIRRQTVFLNRQLAADEKIYHLNILRAYLAMGLELPEVPVSFTTRMNFQAAINEWAAKTWAQAVDIPISRLEYEIVSIAKDPLPDLTIVQQLIGLAKFDFQTHLERIASTIYVHLKIRDVCIWIYEHSLEKQMHRCLDELYTNPPRKKNIPDANEHYCGWHPAIQTANRFFNGELKSKTVIIQKTGFKHWNKSYLTLSLVEETNNPDVVRTYTLGMNIRHLTALNLTEMEETIVFRTCERCEAVNCRIRRSSAHILEQQQIALKYQNQLDQLRKL